MLSIQDKKEINTAIKHQESKTSGEIVTIFAKSSGNYLFTCLLIAVVIALPMPIVLSYFPLLGFIFNHATHIILVQLITLSLVFFVFASYGLGVHFTPRRVRQEKAARLARTQFYKNGLHLTKDRAAILLFVSQAEKHVEIIADKGINDLVGKKEWADIIAGFLDKVKHNQTKGAFLQAINSCGNLLSKHFPLDAGNNKSELPDRLIEI